MGRVIALRLALILTLIVIAQAGAGREPASATTAQPANVPQLIKFSGVLPNATGTMGATFALYKDQTGGAPLWLETQNVALDDKGRYTILLGANHTHGLPLALFATGEAHWLGIQPEGQAELPRVLLVSVPYALKAVDADTLGGRPLSSFVLAGDKTGQSNDGLNYINTKVLQTATSALYAGTPGTIAKFGADGTSMVSSILTENNGKLGVGTSAPTFTLDIQNTDTSAAGAQLLNVQTSSSNGARIFFSSTAANGRAYGIGSNFITGQGEFGVYDYTANVPRMVIGPRGFMGVGVATPEFLLDLATADTTAAGSQLLQLTTPSVNGAKIVFNSTSANGRSYGFGSNFILGQGEFGIYDYKANATRLMVAGTGNVGIGTTNPAATLDVGGNVRISGSGNGLTFADGSTMTSAATMNLTGALTGSTATFTGSNQTGVIVATQQSAGVADPFNAPAALEGIANPSLGNVAYGVAGIASGSGFGVAGKALSASGIGVAGTNMVQSGAEAIGVAGYSISGSGRGVMGSVTGTPPSTCPSNLDTCAFGVKGEASSPSGVTYGVYGEVESPNGRGVYGTASAKSGDATGVKGVTNSPTGVGVWGATGSTGGVGVYGLGLDPTAVGGRFVTAAASGDVLVAAGGANGDLERFAVAADGKVRLGTVPAPTPETVYVAGGEQNLRILRGNVNLNGTCTGVGFTCEKGGTGIYTITYTASFAGSGYGNIPSISITPIGGSPMMFVLPSIGTNGFTVQMYNASGTLADSMFAFVVVGMRM